MWIDNKYITLMSSQLGNFKKKGSDGENYKIRRLTPLECERLQGFDDYWTQSQYKGKPMSDSQRYAQCGNAVTVDVIQYIGSFLK